MGITFSYKEWKNMYDMIMSNDSSNNDLVEEMFKAENIDSIDQNIYDFIVNLKEGNDLKVRLAAIQFNDETLDPELKTFLINIFLKKLVAYYFPKVEVKSINIEL
jgi:hypothetical protein